MAVRRVDELVQVAGVRLAPHGNVPEYVPFLGAAQRGRPARRGVVKPAARRLRWSMDGRGDQHGQRRWLDLGSAHRLHDLQVHADRGNEALREGRRGDDRCSEQAVAGEQLVPVGVTEEDVEEVSGRSTGVNRDDLALQRLYVSAHETCASLQLDLPRALLALSRAQVEAALCVHELPGVPTFLVVDLLDGTHDLGAAVSRLVLALPAQRERKRTESPEPT